ncbi:DUF3788 domain-containing protein [Flavobacterium longum]|uniref:DUF3788 family protein n=1 Tax=Flavobacterium longum TaxID=1299340 RepID=UPI0039EBA779
MTSVFADKDLTPTNVDLEKAIGNTFTLWQEMVSCAMAAGVNRSAEWAYSGAKFGWSFRVKDPKRVIVYLLPRKGFFKIAMVFGQKATDAIMGSDVHESVKAELLAAKPYAEGRGIRIEVRDSLLLEDLKKLLVIKHLN